MRTKVGWQMEILVDGINQGVGARLIGYQKECIIGAMKLVHLQYRHAGHNRIRICTRHHLQHLAKTEWLYLGGEPGKCFGIAAG